MKTLIPLFYLTLIFSGCFEQEIYTEIVDKKYIAHPPSSIFIMDVEGNLKSKFPSNPTSPTPLIVQAIYTQLLEKLQWSR